MEMTITSDPLTYSLVSPTTTTEQPQLHWYAIYTFPRHEKCVAYRLQQRGFDHLLPLHQEVHRWKDRRKVVELALFPGYVFVHMALRDRLAVLQMASVASLVSFQGRPATLPDDDMEALRNGMAHNMRMQPCPYLTVGRRVRIVDGPLTGSTGLLVRKKHACRVVLSVEMIMRSVSVEVPERDIAPLF